MEATKVHLQDPAAPLAIVGLGYVGLPLAVEFGKLRPVVGFDINPARIAELRARRDSTLEVLPEDLIQAHHLSYSSDPETLRSCRVFIVTVPTPVDEYKRPDLGPLLKASETVGRVLKPGDLVIYSGSTPEIAAVVEALYRQIVGAGTHPASSIRVAEAAKVIENTQRDLNIALMNELALIFGRLGIDTLEVLEAAGSKWNFLPFRPGLVGGHCIGVDPYYLTHKAVALGYHPEVILAGRRINDRMGAHVAESVVKLMLRKGIRVCGSRVLVLGLAFKENCPDIRNTRVIDIIRALSDYAIQVDCYDPWVDRAKARHEYGLDCLPEPPAPGA